MFLLDEFVNRVVHSDVDSLQRVAVSIDSRNKEHLHSISAALLDLRELGIGFEIIFLDAEHSVLVKRFSETRRKHPLMDETESLPHSIRLEKKLLRPISERASKHIDTTSMSPHELRMLMQEDAAEPSVGVPTLLIRSFAYKHGTPLDADIVFDVRCLPNPFWVEGLKDFNGLQEPIKQYFADKPVVEDMISHIDGFITRWLPEFRVAGRLYLTVAVGCTGGRHRSVYVVEQLADQCRQRGLKVQKRHTEISER